MNPRSILPLVFLVLLTGLAPGCGDEGGAARAPAGAAPEPDGPDVAGAETRTEEAPGRAAAPWLFAWSADVDRRHDDFLAVLDADPASPEYGRVVTTLTVDRRGTLPHHTEHRMPVSRILFANGFLAGITFRFDLDEPRSPRLLGSFGAAAGYTHPHSYERLPNGNVLATFQGRGEANVDPGGLVEIADSGEIVRSASAADPARPDALIRPYSLAVVPALDRIVVSSYDMGEDMGFDGGRRGRTEVVQVWRLSDLSIVKTIDPPPGPKGYEDEQPGEPRLLADGKTVLVSTFACGLYRIVGLAGEEPTAEHVHSFDGGGCAVPVVHGRWWVQSVPTAHAIVALDVSDPADPREASRLTLGSRNFPHWLALDPGGNRIVIADRGDGERRLFIATIDPESGELGLDEGFRAPGSERAGVSFERGAWPHGSTGAAKPHGTVFGRGGDGS
ncbi:MAG: hypothetical protein R3199_08180 [Gemmatimonadota bacterium]|nr:hypothetical protein [Gemmatimonadota bacterium]